MQFVTKNIILSVLLVLGIACILEQGYSAPANNTRQLKELRSSTDMLLRSAKQAYLQVARIKDIGKIKILFWDFYINAKELHKVLNQASLNHYSEAETAYAQLSYAYQQIQSELVTDEKNPILKRSFFTIRGEYQKFVHELKLSKIFHPDAEVVEYSTKHGKVKKVKNY